jgi:polysaccharide deacetylase family protein (PEP-CTERM system associated)
MTAQNQGRPPLRHALSVDVEDWYHDGGARTAEPEVRVLDNTLRLLDVLERHAVRGTFFFLGEVAERFPALVRRVADAGHEIGSHGYRHRSVRDLTRNEFRRDVADSLRLLEDCAGRAVRGYRAPYFSIKADVRWPSEILADVGFRYDSSVLPIDRPPGLELVSARAPYRHWNGLWELPVAVLQFAHFWHLPLASGGGLRVLPLALLRRWVRRFERDVGAGVFYLHPWEFDADAPTAPGPHRWLLRPGRRRALERLERLLGQAPFGSIADVFGGHLGGEAHATHP